MIPPRLPTFRRRLFAILSLISLFLCIAAGGLWWRSYRASDEVWSRGASDPELLNFWTNPGTLSIWWGISRPTDYIPHGWHHAFVPPFQRFSLFEFDFKDEADPAAVTRSKFWQIRFPLWFPLLLFAIAPACWTLSLRARRRQRRAHLGLCTECGYDLRASATSERCPECGVMFESEARGP